MPRLPELTPETASPAIQKAMAAQMDTFGFVLNSTKLMGYCPDVAKASNVMGEAIDGEGNIEESLRYLLYSKVASMNGCPF